jgi:hypothetical protein
LKEVTWDFPYRNVEEIGFVYIYLIDDGVPVSFYTIPASELTNPNAEYMWCVMKAD